MNIEIYEKNGRTFMTSMSQTAKVITCKFSKYQLDIIECSLKFALQDYSIFDGKAQLIAEVLLQEIKDLK